MEWRLQFGGRRDGLQGSARSRNPFATNAYHFLMPPRRCSIAVALACAVMLIGRAVPCCAINVVIDYSRDDNLFFGSGNPAGQGAAARAAVQAAAAYFSNILTDTFDALQAPPTFTATNGGTVSWTWDASFSHPATGAQTDLNMAVIPANEYRIFVGARSFAGTTLAEGGPGGTPGWERHVSGSCCGAQNAQVIEIEEAFLSSLQTRGETSGFVRFGGSISFDRRASTAWHYNHNTAPAAGTNDLYSVALHEMAHALGFGAPGEWSNLATGSHFSGAAAAAAYGGAPPLRPFTSGIEESPKHWDFNTMSGVLGTGVVQEALMDPDLTVGTRKHVTALDAGALVDIGWSITIPTFNAADFNRDGTVNRPDLTVWRSAFRINANADADGDGDSDGRDLLVWQRRLGQHAVDASRVIPEPTAAALMAWAFGLRFLRRRHAR
jgi:hypothetical protein